MGKTYPCLLCQWSVLSYLKGIILGADALLSPIVYVSGGPLYNCTVYRLGSWFHCGMWGTPASSCKVTMGPLLLTHSVHEVEPLIYRAVNRISEIQRMCGSPRGSYNACMGPLLHCAVCMLTDI